MDSFGTPRVPFVPRRGRPPVGRRRQALHRPAGRDRRQLLGHAHPAVVAAVSQQIATLGHVSNLFMAEPTITSADG